MKPCIAHLITGLDAGGAERTLARLISAGNRTSLPAIVVSMTDIGRIGADLQAAGITVCTLGMRRGVADPRGITRLVSLLRRYRPAILQTWLYHADLLGAVVHCLGYAPRLLWNVRCTESVDTVTIRAVLARLSILPDAVIVNSLAGRRVHEKLGYRPKRWEYIPNGFPTDQFRPDDAARLRLRADWGIDGDTFVVGLPARYHPMKDHRTFLAAAARLRAEHQKIMFALMGAGNGPDNRELMSLIAHHGLAAHVRLLGEHPDMSVVYPALDLVTLSSAFGEGFPNVLGEAMACGVPCVATDSGDAAEIVGPAGSIVRPRDPEALAAGWRRMIEAGPEARGKIGEAARERVMRLYELKGIASRYQTLYEEMANTAGSVQKNKALVHT